MVFEGENSLKLDVKEHRGLNEQLFKTEEINIVGDKETLELEEKGHELMELDEKEAKAPSKEEDDIRPLQEDNKIEVTKDLFIPEEKMLELESSGKLEDFKLKKSLELDNNVLKFEKDTLNSFEEELELDWLEELETGDITVRLPELCDIVKDITLVEGIVTRVSEWRSGEVLEDSLTAYEILLRLE